MAWRGADGLAWSVGLGLADMAVAYAGDASANAVLDKRTGLHWRSCELGQRLSGSASVAV